MPNEFVNFDSSGVLGNMENGMSLEDCVNVGLKNNWKNVGYRQAALGDVAHSCFITGDTNYNIREFVENGGLPHDAGNHVTVDLSGVATS